MRRVRETMRRSAAPWTQLTPVAACSWCDERPQNAHQLRRVGVQTRSFAGLELLVLVQGLVERDARAVALDDFHRAGQRVAPEQQIATTGQLAGLDRLAVG